MTPNGLITIIALLFVGMCFTLVVDMFWMALGLFVTLCAVFIIVLIG